MSAGVYWAMLDFASSICLVQPIVSSMPARGASISTAVLSDSVVVEEVRPSVSERMVASIKPAMFFSHPAPGMGRFACRDREKSTAPADPIGRTSTSSLD